MSNGPTTNLKTVRVSSRRSKMPPLTVLEESVIQALEATRSVSATAEQLAIPVDHVQKVAMMAFGLGRLEVGLRDF